jgi:ribosomal-protein-serine acetyltransferase
VGDAVFNITEAVSLRPLRLSDTAELFALTDANRAHLRRWLPWLDAVQVEEHSREFVESAMAQHAAGRGPVFAILHDGGIAGVVGFHPIRPIHAVGEIGYWLAESQQGRGIMTACCKFVVRYGFHSLNLNRLEIAVATGNHKSRAIPERLGFRLEGILRSRENLYGTFVDHAMYAMLRSEHSATR